MISPIFQTAGGSVASRVLVKSWHYHSRTSSFMRVFQREKKSGSLVSTIWRRIDKAPSTYSDSGHRWLQFLKVWLDYFMYIWRWVQKLEDLFFRSCCDRHMNTETKPPTHTTSAASSKATWATRNGADTKSPRASPKSVDPCAERAGKRMVAQLSGQRSGDRGRGDRYIPRGCWEQYAQDRAGDGFEYVVDALSAYDTLPLWRSY